MSHVLKKPATVIFVNLQNFSLMLRRLDWQGLENTRHSVNGLKEHFILFRVLLKRERTNKVCLIERILFLIVFPSFTDSSKLRWVFTIQSWNFTATGGYGI